MSDADTIAEPMVDSFRKWAGGHTSYLAVASIYVRKQMPDEPHAVVDDVAEALWLMSAR